MSHSYYFIVLLLCCVWNTSSGNSITLKSLIKTRYVIVSRPQNVTVFLKAEDRLVVSWSLPQIYVPHDVYGDKFETLKNGDQVDVVSPEPNVVVNRTTTSPALNSTQEPNGTEANATSQTGTSTTGEVNGDNNMSSDKDPTPTSDETAENTPVNLMTVVCHSLAYFANDTVGGKDAKVKDNGWAVSLVETDEPIKLSNVSSMKYDNKTQRLVKFEEGCITKIVVTYSRQDGRPTVREVVLNASDHLATIDNLKQATHYKIEVTAHFVSGDSLTSQAMFAATMNKGVTPFCRCDWHGTENLTSNCDNPSKSHQHCKCRNDYVGRFCEDCACGYYRTSPSVACKKCPCGEHADVKFETSCGFVEGFLHCDKCPEGYTGSLCHKCAQGYYRLREKCHKCKCHGLAPKCHPTTGSCIDCHNDRDGFFCERCKRGYVENKDKMCVKLNGTKAGTSLPVDKSSSSSSMSSGVIAAVIFVIILCVSVVVGLLVCRRIRANRQRRALWTVEMRPDHDDLDFNTVHNEDAHMDDIDDMEFYDRHAGRNKTSGKYSKLNEDV